MERPWILILSALCCATSLSFAPPHAYAQVSFDTPPSADSDAPVTGKPYEADKVMHTRRVLADGTATSRDFQVHEARDSQGRVVVELDTTLQLRPNGPETSFVTVIVNDPVAGTSLLWNSLNHLATRNHTVSEKLLELRAEASGKPLPIPAKPEILGQRMIDGRMTTGRFTEKPIPAGTMGNATATVDKREWWTDEALHLIVLSTGSNPLHGEQTTELRSLKLVEPDPSRFQPPDGYTVHDIGLPDTTGIHLRALTSPPQPLDLAHAPALSHADAMLKLSSGDDADKAIGAAVLVKEAQASSDISLRADVAYTLAMRDIGLPEAEQLADQTLNTIETAPTLESPDKISQADFERETTLSHCWEAMGLIYFHRDRYDLALPYLQSAWLLDPLAYYGRHFGRLLEAQGDNAAAIRIYREALSASGSSSEKRTIRDRITALSTGPDMQSDLQPIKLPQPTLDDVKAPSDGTAFFDLIYSSTTTSTTAAIAPAPQIFFVSGTEALKPLASAIAKSLPPDFTLPDKGPEIVARLIELTCKTGSPSPCQLQLLSARQANYFLRQRP